MKKIIATLALAASLAAFAAHEVPETWKSQYKPPAQSALGWSLWNIYQYQTWIKALNPRANVSNLLPEPKITARVHWDGYTPYKSAKAIFIFHCQDAGAATGEIKFSADAVRSPFQILSFKTPANGRLIQGRHIVGAFLDFDGNNSWTPGEPYGIATDVDISWSSAAFDIELSDVAPQTMRINLMDAAQANDFESQKSLNDRGVQNSGNVGANIPITDIAIGTEMPTMAETATRIRIVRTRLNEFIQYKNQVGYVYYPNDEVLDVTRNLSVNQIFSERDVLASGNLDLDWGGLPAVAQRMNMKVADITSVAYRMVFGDGTTNPALLTNNNNLATAFVNVFEAGAAGTQSKCVPVAPLGGVIYSAQPTFTWKHDSPIGKRYPAFQLRVWDGATCIYDSGALRAPTRNLNGEYSWTAPIYADMVTPSGHIFSNTNNYTWSVSMLDAKFTTPNAAETKAAFTMSSDWNNQPLSGYGSIAATVQYSGNVPVSSNPVEINGVLHIQVFSSPDFSGIPVVEGRVVDASALASGTTVTLYAIPVGMYYVRAYIDSNGNFNLDGNEPWGYSMTSDATLRPRQIVVRSQTTTTASLILSD